MATTYNKVKNVVLGVTAATTVVASAYAVTNLFNKERDYSDILVESAKKYVENNNLAIDSRYVTTVSRLRESGSLVSDLNLPDNACVAITKEDGELTYEPLTSCEGEIVVAANDEELGYKITASAVNLTNGNVEINVLFSEEIQNVSVQGWSLSSDKKLLTKIFTENGTDSLEVHSLNGNKSVNIEVSTSNIDKDAPVILVNGQSVLSSYGTGVNLSVLDDNLDVVSVNGGELTTKTITQNGTYEVVATDLAGNTSVATFAVGRAAALPTISSPANGTVLVGSDIRIGTNNGTGTLYIYNEDGTRDVVVESIKAGTVRNVAEGRYELVVVNEDGVEVSSNFSVDRSDPEAHAYIYEELDENGEPIILGELASGQVTNKNVVFYYSDAYSDVHAAIPGDPDAVLTGDTYTKDGNYTIIVTDGGNHSVEFDFTINRKAPDVTGVKTGEFYADDVTIGFDESIVKSATLDGASFNPGTVSDEGTHTLVVKDAAGNTNEVVFTIDKTAPKFEGLEANLVTSDSFEVVATDDNLANVVITRDGATFGGTTLSEEGVYTLTATDKAGNSTTRTVTIDKTAPVITIGDVDYQGTENEISDFFDGDLSFSVSDETATKVYLDDKDNGLFEGNTVSSNGLHTLIVVDEAGNETSVNFLIVNGVPSVKFTSDGVELVIDDNNVSVVHYFNKDVSISFDHLDTISKIELTNPEGETETLTTQEEIAAGLTKLAGSDSHHEYTLVVTDIAGRTTTVTFAIDTKKPEANVGSSILAEDTTITFDDEAGIKEAFITDPTGARTQIASGEYTMTIEGDYTLEITDNSGNTRVYYPVLDKSAPTITYTIQNEDSDVDVDHSDLNVDEETDKIYFNKAVKVTLTDAYSYIKVTDKDGNVLVDFDGETKTYETDYLNDGEYTFTVVDRVNHETSATIVVDTEDPSLLIASEDVKYTGEEATELVVDAVKLTLIVTENEDVTLVDSNGLVWTKVGTSVDGRIQYETVITETPEGKELTGSVTVTDKAGNHSIVGYHATVDKVAPSAVIPAITGERTNEDVTVSLYASEQVTLSDENENIIWSQNGELVSNGEHAGMYLYTGVASESIANGSVTVADANNNKTTVTYAVTNIDKEVDIISITYSNANDEGEEQPVVGSVTVTITASEQLTVPNFGQHSWTETVENGIYTYVTEVDDNLTRTLTISDGLNSKDVEIVVEGIDNDGPEVFGFDEDKYVESASLYLYAGNVTPTFTEEGAYAVLKVQNEAGEFEVIDDNFVSGTEVTGTANRDIEYLLEVFDALGNKTSVYFRIDRLTPDATNVVYSETEPTQNAVIVTITFNEPVEPQGNSAAVTKALTKVDDYTWEFKKSVNGSQTIKFVDAAGNTGTVKVSVNNIDKVAPTIEGVEDGGLYNTVKNVTFADADSPVSATLNGEAFYGNDPEDDNDVLSDGVYTLIVTDAAGNSITYRFTIDTIAPIISGIVHQGNYNYTVEPSFNEGTAVLTKQVVGEDGTIQDVVIDGYESGQSIAEEGIYTLVVTDEAGNHSDFTFTIDKTTPTADVESNVEAGKYTNQSVTLTITTSEPVKMLTTDANLTKVDDSTYTFLMEDNGTFTIHFEDAAGNQGSKDLVVNNIDKIPPKVTAVTESGIVVQNGESYNESIFITYTDENSVLGYLNGDYTGAQTTVAEEGTYELVVTDAADNTVTYTFTVDKTAPVISGITDGGMYNKAVSPSFNEGIGVLTKKVVDEFGAITDVVVDGFESGDEITEDGVYTLTVTDGANNGTSYTFTVDRTAPFAVDVSYSNEELTNQPVIVTIKFSEPVEMVGNSTAVTNALKQVDDLTWEFTKSISGSQTIKFVDAAGNAGTVKVTVNNIDKVKPVGTITFDDTPTAGPVELKLSVTEPIKDFSEDGWNENGTEDVVETAEDGTETTKTYYIYNKSISSNTNGTVTLKYTDLAGNAGSAKYSVSNIDSDAPTINVEGTESEDYAGLYTGTVTVTVSDTNLASASYTKDGGEEVAIEDGSVELSESGTYTITAIDSFGKEATPVTITIDNSDPIITVSPVDEDDKVSNTLYTGSVKVTIDEANVKTLSVGGLPVSEPWTEKTFTQDGTYTIKVVDKVGRETTVTFTIDASVPVITIPGGDVIVTIKGKDITYPDVTAYDDKDGDLEVTADKETIDINTAGIYTINYSATDKAGNTAYAALTIRVLDADKFFEYKEEMELLAEEAEGCTYFSCVTRNKNDYTDSSWRIRMNWVSTIDYLVGGETLHLNTRFTQELLDNYISYIEKAPLVPDSLYLDEYNKQLAIIGGLHEEDYTATSWKSLMDVVAEAAEKIELQSDVNLYTNRLKGELGWVLTANPVTDTTSDYMDKYLEEDYSGYDNYQASLRAVSANVHNMLQSEYDAAIKDIEDTMLATRLPIDDSAFKALLKNLEDNYTEADYTPESWADLQDKIDAVQEVIDNNGLRSEYRVAFEEIDLSDLVPVGYDTDAFDTLVADFNKLVESDYTPESWKAVEDQIAVVQDIIDNGGLASEFASELAKASLDNLVQLPIDTTEFDKIVTEFEGLDQNDYEADSYDAIAKLISDAKQLVTDGALRSAFAEVFDQIDLDDLEALAIDSSAFDQFKEDFGELVETDYTPESWSAIEDQIAVVQNIVDNNGLRSEYATEFGKLDLEDLVALALDTDAFDALYAQFNDLDSEDYTADSYKTLKDMFEAAQAVIDRNGLRSEFEAATKDITLDILVALPKVDNATISVSGNANEGYAIAGDVVTVTFGSNAELNLTSSDENLTVTTVMINGELAKVTKNEETGMYEAEITITSSSTEGEISYTIAPVSVDQLVGAQVTETETGIVVDVTPAKVTLIPSTGGQTQGPVTLTLTSDEALIITSDEDEWTSNADNTVFTLTVYENQTVEVEYTDEAGNAGSKSLLVNNIDTDAPTATITADNSADTKGDIVLTLAPSEEIENIVTTITTSTGAVITDATWTRSESANEYTLTITENAVVSVTFQDLAKLTGSATITVDNIDKTPATVESITYSNNGAPTSDDVTITMITSESVTIEDDKLDWSDGEELEDGTYKYTATASSNFSNTIKLVDHVGNETENVTYTISGIDKVAPTITLAGTNVEGTNIYTSDVVATITEANIKTATYTLNGVAYTIDTTSIVDGVLYVTFANEGVYSVTVEDTAGSDVTVDFTIDKNAPVITIEGKTLIVVTDEKDIEAQMPTVTVTDTVDSTVELETTKTTVDGVTTITYTATDNAGHDADAKSIEIRVIDIDALTAIENDIAELEDASEGVTFETATEENVYDYTAESIANQKAAIAELKANIAGTGSEALENITQEYVNNRVSEIKAMREVETIVTTEFDQLVAEVKRIDEANYDTTVEGFEDALENARELIETDVDTIKLQSELNAIVAQLKADLAIVDSATKTIVTNVTFTTDENGAVTAITVDADKDTEMVYLVENYSNFATVVSTLDTLLADVENGTVRLQSAYNNAVDAAIDSLVKIDIKTTSAYRTFVAIEDAFNNMTAEEIAEYTEASYNARKEAIEAARAVAEDSTKFVSDFNAAMAEVTNNQLAEKALVADVTVSTSGNVYEDGSMYAKAGDEITINFTTTGSKTLVVINGQVVSAQPVMDEEGNVVSYDAVLKVTDGMNAENISYTITPYEEDGSTVGKVYTGTADVVIDTTSVTGSTRNYVRNSDGGFVSYNNNGTRKNVFIRITSKKELSAIMNGDEDVTANWIPVIDRENDTYTYILEVSQDCAGSLTIVDKAGNEGSVSYSVVGIDKSILFEDGNDQFATVEGTSISVPTPVATDADENYVEVELVDNGGLDFNVAGTYTLTYAAKNDASATKTVTVVVLKTATITADKITVDGKDYYVINYTNSSTIVAELGDLLATVQAGTFMTQASYDAQAASILAELDKIDIKSTDAYAAFVELEESFNNMTAEEIANYTDASYDARKDAIEAARRVADDASKFVTDFNAAMETVENSQLSEKVTATVTAVSTNGNNYEGVNYAIAGQEVYVDFTTDASSVDVTINGESATVTSVGNSYRATLTVAKGMDTEGIEYTITPYDEEGNTGKVVSSRNENIVIDTVAPKVIEEINPKDLTNLDKVISITLDEDIICTNLASSHVSVSEDGRTLSVTMTANGSFAFKYTDLAGNSVRYSVTVEGIDKTPVTGSTANFTVVTDEDGNESYVAYDNTAVSEDVYIRLTSNKKLTSISDENHTWDVEDFEQVDSSYIYTIKVSEDTNGTLSITDEAGNVTDGIVYNVTGIDKVAPTIDLAGTNVEGTNIYTSDVVATITETHIKTATYTLNGVTSAIDTTSIVDGVLNVTFANEGTYNITITDITGETATVDFTIDKDAPVITVEGKTLIVVTDEKDIEAQMPTVTVTDTVDSTVELVTTKTTVDGVTTITYTATDNAGHDADAKSIEIRVIDIDALTAIENDIAELEDASEGVTFETATEENVYDYTAESIANQKAAIAELKANIAGTGSEALENITQEYVNNRVSEIEAMREAETIVTTEFDQLVAEVEAINEEDYDTTIEGFEDALENARDLIKTDVTAFELQSELNAIVAQLKAELAVINSAQANVVDTTATIKAQYAEENYNNYAEFVSALDALSARVNDPEDRILKGEYDAAVESAIALLEKIDIKSTDAYAEFVALESAFNNMTAEEIAEYTEASYNARKEAIEAAREVADDSTKFVSDFNAVMPEVENATLVRIPRVISHSITTSNSNKNYATVGDVVTVSFESKVDLVLVSSETEELASAISINNQMATITKVGTRIDETTGDTIYMYESSITITEKSSVGEVEYTIFPVGPNQFVDGSNIVPPTMSGITVDVTAPELNITYVTGEIVDGEIVGREDYNPLTDKTNKNVIVILSANEALETISDTNADNDAQWNQYYMIEVSADCNGELTVTDAAGNESTISYEVKGIDKTPATGTTANFTKNSEGEYVSYNNTITNSDVYIRLTASEKLSAISDDNHAWDVTEFEQSGSDYIYTIKVSEDTNGTLTITDEAGNVTDGIVYNVTGIDTDAPAITVVIGETTVVEGTYYKGVATIAVPEGTLYDGEVVLNENGETSVEISTTGIHNLKVVDAAGNTSTFELRLDNDAPEVTFTNANGDEIEVVNNKAYFEKITVSVTDNVTSDENLTVTLNGVTFTNGTTLEEGHYVLVVSDELGNTDTVEFDIDLSDPTIEGYVPGKTIYDENIQVGVDRGILIVDGELVPVGKLVTLEDGTHTIVVTSPSGNEVVNTTVTVDTVAPKLTVVYGNTTYANDFEITLEASNEAFDADKYFTAIASDATTNATVTSTNDINLAQVTESGAPYTATYTATDEAGNTTTITVKVNVEDSEGPVITLNSPDSIIELPFGGTFSDPYGATATDALDGDVTVTTNYDNVDTNDTTRTYVITYTATDKAGNTSTKTRQVKVTATTTNLLVRSLNVCREDTLCYGSYSPNNYVWYSGHLWRVVKVNRDQTLQLIAEDSQSGFSYDDDSSVFDGSYVDQWLNEVFYPSLNNADTIVATGEFCNQANNTTGSIRYVCGADYVANKKVGLLSIDDYRILDAQAGFLNNGERFFTMTPTHDQSVWVVHEDGTQVANHYVNEPYAIRPVININPVAVLSGRGTAEDPFIIDEGNNDAANQELTTRASGEYVSFGGKTWRIVSTSEEGTKLITDDYLTVGDEYTTVAYGSMGNFTTESGVGAYLHTTVYNGLTATEKSVVKLTRFYNNKYLIGDNPITTQTNGTYTDAYVGLIRVGELMSGNTTSTRKINGFAYWTTTSANANSWFVNWAGTSEYTSSSDVAGLRPVITLDKSVKIASGNGTEISPFELELK